jgi:hypothetical protein
MDLTAMSFAPDPMAAGGASTSSSSNSRSFDDVDHAMQLLHALNDFRHQPLLCDVIIKVDGRSFNAHRCVLAAAIPYFRSMFNARMIESILGEIEIQV